MTTEQDKARRQKLTGASDRPERWTQALLTVQPSGKAATSRETRAAGGRRDKASQARLDQAVWAAVDSGSMVALEHALAQGGRANISRNGMSPLWAAVESQRQDLARVLLEAGARADTTGPQGRSLWAAVASRNNVEEGRRLLDLLGGKAFGSPMDFFPTRSYQLLWWWLSEAGGSGIPQPPRTAGAPRPDAGEFLGNWFLAAIHGPEPILEALNKSWGIQAGQPNALSRTWGPVACYMVWEELARRDNVALAQRIWAAGWGPARPTDFPEGRFRQKDQAWEWEWAWSPAWYFLGKRAKFLWAWWMGVAELRDEVLEQAAAEPSQTLWRAVRDVPSLETLAKAGVDLGVRDGQGQTLLHHLMGSSKASLALGRWFLRHRPQDFQALDGQGRRPLDVPVHKDAHAAVRPRLLGLWMDAQVRGGTGKREARTRL